MLISVLFYNGTNKTKIKLYDSIGGENCRRLKQNKNDQIAVSFDLRVSVFTH